MFPLLLVVVLSLTRVPALLMVRVPEVVVAMRLRMIFLIGAGMEPSRHLRRSTLEVDVDPSCIVFGGVLQPQLAAYLFHAGLDLLDVAWRMVPFPHDAREQGHRCSVLLACMALTREDGSALEPARAGFAVRECPRLLRRIGREDQWYHRLPCPEHCSLGR